MVPARHPSEAHPSRTRPLPRCLRPYASQASR
jgi:hypothetical protein